jgi:hypothetical protein
VLWRVLVSSIYPCRIQHQQRTGPSCTTASQFIQPVQQSIKWSVSQSISQFSVQHALHIFQRTHHHTYLPGERASRAPGNSCKAHHLHVPTLCLPGPRPCYSHIWKQPSNLLYSQFVLKSLLGSNTAAYTSAACEAVSYTRARTCPAEALHYWRLACCCLGCCCRSRLCIMPTC